MLIVQVLLGKQTKYWLIKPCLFERLKPYGMSKTLICEGESVSEPQKTPQEAWRSLCCFRYDMSWGIWYLGVVMPHTAHMQLQAKKQNSDGNARKSQDVSTTCSDILCFRCLCFTEQLQFSERHSTDLSSSFSTLALKYSWGDSWIYCVIVQWWMIVQLSMCHWSTNQWKSKRSWWIFRSIISIDWAWPEAAVQGRMNVCCKQTVLSKLPSNNSQGILTTYC